MREFWRSPPSVAVVNSVGCCPFRLLLRLRHRRSHIDLFFISDIVTIIDGDGTAGRSVFDGAVGRIVVVRSVGWIVVVGSVGRSVGSVVGILGEVGGRWGLGFGHGLRR